MYTPLTQLWPFSNGLIASLYFCQGSCLQGYFCQGGAMEPAPQSSDNFPRNGPCPAGHYCPTGCLSPIPCPYGSIRNSTGTPTVYTLYHTFSYCIGTCICIWKSFKWGLLCSACVICICCPPVIGGVSMESCSACPAGHYCSTEGLASPSGPCAAGFYCPFDFSSTTPYAFLCPKARVNHTLFSLYSLFPSLSFPFPLFLLFS